MSSNERTIRLSSDESFPASSSLSNGPIPSFCSFTLNPETYASPAAARDGTVPNVAVDDMTAASVNASRDRIPLRGTVCIEVRCLMNCGFAVRRSKVSQLTHAIVELTYRAYHFS